MAAQNEEMDCVLFSKGMVAFNYLSIYQSSRHWGHNFLNSQAFRAASPVATEILACKISNTYYLA